MTNTYAAIDNHSGLIWGVTDADDAMSAAKAIDADVDRSAAATARYEETDCSSLADGYYVYEVPAEHVAEARDWGADDAERVEEVCTARPDAIEVTRHAEA